MKYIEAIGRNPGEEYQHSHLYAVDEKHDHVLMCIYGWNRSNGTRLSIFRGHRGAKGLCKICEHRAKMNLLPLTDGASHKTKWL